MTKQRNTVIGLYDRPLRRDWAFWVSVVLLFFAVLPAFAPAEGSEQAPFYIFVWLSPLVIFATFCLPMVAIRLLVRRTLRSRRGRDAAPGDVGRREPTSDPAARPAIPTAPAVAPGSSSAPRPTIAAFHPGPGDGPTTWGAPSEIALRAQADFPYPVARAARAVNSAADALEKYQLVLDLGEALSITLGVTSISWLRVHDPGSPALAILRNRMDAGLSQGAWIEVTDAARKAMTSSSDALPGFVEATRARKGGKGLLPDLKQLVEERNRAAHGSRPHNRAEAADRIATYLPLVEQCLTWVEFLRDLEWVVVDSSAYRRRDQLFDVRLRRAMGDHPEFEALTRTTTEPLAPDTFYLVAPDMVLDLTPFVVLRYCDRCRQPEVCYADKILAKQGISLRSFGRGHQVLAPDLVAEVEDLASNSDGGGPNDLTQRSVVEPG